MKPSEVKNKLIFQWSNKVNVSERLKQFLFEMDEYFIPNLSDRVCINNYAEKLSEKAETLFVLFDGVVIASCSVYCNANFAYISSFAVKKQFSGMHIGSLMMQTILNKCTELGFHEVRLEVFIANESAIQFYNHHGFQQFEKSSESMILIKYL